MALQEVKSNQERNRPDSDEMSLKEIVYKSRQIINYLVSKYLICITVGIFGALVGLGIAYIKHATYTATTTFVLESGESGGGGLGQYAGIASMVGIDFAGGGGGIFQGDNIIELYKSRKMIEQTLYSNIQEDSTQLLIDRYLNIKGWKEKWSDNPQLRNFNFKDAINTKTNSARLRDSLVTVVVDDIKKNYLIVSKPDKKLSIIKVDFKSPDELFSKNFNDNLVRNVNDFYVQTKTKKALQTVSNLQHQADSVRRILNGAINNVANIADATPNLNPARQTLRAPAQRSQFNADANKAILSELVKNLELSKMNLRQETPLIQIIDKPVYPLNVDMLTKTRGLVFGFAIGAGLTIIALIFQFIIKSFLQDE